VTGDEGERGDEGDDSFLEPKKESKKAALRRKSQADKAGRRQSCLRVCPAAGKNLNRSVWSKLRPGDSSFFPYGLALPARADENRRAAGALIEYICQAYLFAIIR